MSGFSRLSIVSMCVLCLGMAQPAAALEEICGDVDGNGEIVTSDALLVLATAVGQTLPPLVCPYDACGNGNVEGAESCDQGDLGGTTCVDLGLYADGLTCGSECQFDPTGCSQTRYTDNTDGTLMDNQTGLQWELKTDDDSVHDKDNTYTWSESGSVPDGSALVDFLGTLNNCVEEPGFPPTGVTGGFAGHCDCGCRRSWSCRRSSIPTRPDA